MYVGRFMAIYNTEYRPTATGAYSFLKCLSLELSVAAETESTIMGLDRKLQYHSATGCCICGTKTSSSRFTSSTRFESLFVPCFGITYDDRRSGDICNACVLIVKRFRNSPRDSCKNWAHVSYMLILLLKLRIIT